MRPCYFLTRGLWHSGCLCLCAHTHFSSSVMDKHISGVESPLVTCILENTRRCFPTFKPLPVSKCSLFWVSCLPTQAGQLLEVPGLRMSNWGPNNHLRSAVETETSLVTTMLPRRLQIVRPLSQSLTLVLVSNPVTVCPRKNGICGFVGKLMWKKEVSQHRRKRHYSRTCLCSLPFCFEAWGLLTPGLRCTCNVVPSTVWVCSVWRSPQLVTCSEHLWRAAALDRMESAQLWCFLQVSLNWAFVPTHCSELVTVEVICTRNSTSRNHHWLCQFW